MASGFIGFIKFEILNKKNSKHLKPIIFFQKLDIGVYQMLIPFGNFWESALGKYLHQAFEKRKVQRVKLKKCIQETNPPKKRRRKKCSIAEVIYLEL